jgi:hypothetical protein
VAHPFHCCSDFGTASSRRSQRSAFWHSLTHCALDACSAVTPRAHWRRFAHDAAPRLHPRALRSRLGAAAFTCISEMSASSADFCSVSSVRACLCHPTAAQAIALMPTKPAAAQDQHDAGERIISIFVAEKFYFLVTNFTNCVIRHLPALASRFGLPAITRCM